MKKFLIVTIVLLIILAIGQEIYYKTRPINISSNSFEDSYEESTIQEEKLLEIKELDSIYNEYSPKISMENLQKNMYKFINSLSVLENEIQDKNTEQLKTYYQENIILIVQNYYINSEKEFIMIAKQIQNIFNANNAVLYEYGIELASISQLQNGIISFNMIFTFDNNMTLKIKVLLSQKSENMLIRSASDLDKIYESYTGNVKRMQVLDKINTFATNATTLRTATSLKSENEKREYFDLNDKTMQELGITTQDDLISVAYQINNMNWAYGTITFENYSINYESLKNEQDYTSFEVKLYFSNGNEMHLIMSIGNNENAEPSIKIKGNNQDILDKIHELDPNINLNEIDINNL